MRVFAHKYRGFKLIDIDLSKLTFLVGDNSAGKSSILYLVNSVMKEELYSAPRLDDGFGLQEYDYFSPYFNYEDVSFGFESEKPGFEFIKIITVKRQKNLPPRVTRCSYIVDGTLITLRRYRNIIQYRIRKNYQVSDTLTDLSSHLDDVGFKKLNGANNSNILDSSNIITLVENVDKTILSSARKVLGFVLGDSRIISPIRALPEPFYQFRRRSDAKGLHFASMWHDFSQFEDQRMFDCISAFGKESGLFDRIEVRKISPKLEESPLIVYIIKSDKRMLLGQVGVGVSQVVPVLIEAVFSVGASDTLTLMQQPELHLHPVAQAALGTFFYKAAGYGLRGLIETHSSYFLDRLRAEIRDSSFKPAPKFEDAAPDNKTSKKNNVRSISSDSFKLLFCLNNKDGNEVLTINIDDKGKLIGEPDSYHQFFIDEMVRTMF